MMELPHSGISQGFPYRISNRVDLPKTDQLLKQLKRKCGDGVYQKTYRILNQVDLLLAQLKTECEKVVYQKAKEILSQNDLPKIDQFLEQLKEKCGHETYQKAKEIFNQEDLFGTDQFLEKPEKNHGIIRVRQEIINILSSVYPSYNILHRDLLHLFNNGPVRIITTNFDCLFEQAAEELFKTSSKIFEAPTLPLGSRFQGIVHLRGSVRDIKELKEMVLTKRDFGRAYLTEASGWTCRFLIDLFANYIVLFVGYSHRDTIMTYLAKSLRSGDGAEKGKPGKYLNETTPLSGNPVATRLLNKGRWPGANSPVFP